MEESPLEPMIAHGSRMSWAGILRPGNEFAPAKKSQIAVITEVSGERVTRSLGNWNSSYRRFTTNFSSPELKVEAVHPGEKTGKGIQCILHWIERSDMIRSDEGGVCYGDGWPKELWDAFISEASTLAGETIAKKLRVFLDSDLKGENRMVAQWRSRVREGVLVPPNEQSEIDKSWLPVPAKLFLDDKESECIFSWSPGASFFHSLSEALASPEARQKKPDLSNQARYYLECTLAKLHGINFDDPNDFLEDRKYALCSEVKEIQDSFSKLELERISKFGRLDKFGF
jgi:hypothetical protein